MNMQHSPRVILFLDTSRGFGRGILKGISRYSALNGRWSFYHRQPSYLSSRKAFDLSEFKSWKPDGIVCSVSQSESLLELGAPMICFDIGDYDGELPCIVTDDAAAGELAAQHLLSIGHRDFAFCGFNSLKWSIDRQNSFCRQIEEAGCTVNVYKGLRGNPPWSREEKHIKRWIHSLPKPVGLFCGNDDRAASIAATCISLGFSMPEDISIIGADDDELVCEVVNPPLSSVRIASDQGGYEASALLEQIIKGEAKMEGQRLLSPAPGIHTRQSTDVLMVENAVVRKALQYIRKNVNQPVRVGDVVVAAGVCHRTLSDMFHAELGTSIGKHLTNARIDYISHLLVDTDMRVQEIAAAVGYEDDRHFSRYFKRSTWLTPQAYRRKMLTP